MASWKRVQKAQALNSPDEMLRRWQRAYDQVQLNLAWVVADLNQKYGNLPVAVRQNTAALFR